MQRLVLHLVVLLVVSALLAVGASPARSHWDQPHQIIGGLTRIIDLSERHRKFFSECSSEGSFHEGLVRPDVRRDSAFFLTRLFYIREHQRSADRSQNAYQAAAHKYTEAVRKGDKRAACQAISQLSESVHYLQDAADATKNLDDCRKQISRLVSSYVVKRISSDKNLMNALRRSHDAAQPTIASLQVMPPKKTKPAASAQDNAPSTVANHLLKQREVYIERFNSAFDRYKKKNIKTLNCLNNLSGRDDDLDDKLDKELDPDLREELISLVIDMFGLMWAAQDRYAWQFVQGNWYLITAMVIYREGTNPEMRCTRTIKRVVETGASEAEREQALEQVRQEIKHLVTTGQVNYISIPVASVIRTSDEKIDLHSDSDPKPKCEPVSRTLTSPLEDCPQVCVQWTLGPWQASDGRNIDCCPYPAEKKCIEVKCKKEYTCEHRERRCDGGVPMPLPVESSPYSPGYVPGGGVSLGSVDPGVSITPPDQGVIVTTPPNIYIPPPAPVYVPPQVQTQQPPIRTIQPPQTYVRHPQVQTQQPPIRSTQPPQTYVSPLEQGVTTRPPPQERCAQINSALIAASRAKDIHRFRALVKQARIENCAFTQKAYNHLRNWEQQSQHSATQSQNQPPLRPPVQSPPPETDVKPPQQGITTRPPQQGISAGVKDTRSNQVIKPPCRCLKQVKYWFASDGRHNTCCPNPEQKRCIGTKCELKTKCLQWGPPGCVPSPSVR